jgi:hypothetical protein
MKEKPMIPHEVFTTIFVQLTYQTSAKTQLALSGSLKTEISAYNTLALSRIATSRISMREGGPSVLSTTNAMSPSAKSQGANLEASSKLYVATTMFRLVSRNHARKKLLLQLDTATCILADIQIANVARRRRDLVVGSHFALITSAPIMSAKP